MNIILWRRANVLPCSVGKESGQFLSKKNLKKDSKNSQSHTFITRVYYAFLTYYNNVLNTHHSNKPRLKMRSIFKTLTNRNLNHTVSKIFVSTCLLTTSVLTAQSMAHTTFYIFRHGKTEYRVVFQESRIQKRPRQYLVPENVPKWSSFGKIFRFNRGSNVMFCHFRDIFAEPPCTTTKTCFKDGCPSR